MDFPAALPDSTRAVRGALAGAIENMRGGGQGLTTGAEGMGLAGVELFAETYPEWPRRFGEKLDAAMHGLRVFIVKAGTGGALFRGLHARFARDAGSLLDDSPLHDVAAVYDDLAAEWVALADADGHAAGLPHVERIASLEAAGVEAMERALADG
jgi:hypothetical protein